MLTINVAPDGSGQFTTISEAVLAVPYDCPAVIRIAPGIYREKLVCEKKDITLAGAGWVAKQVELSAAAGDAPEKLAETLVQTARIRAQKTGRPDDITAAVLRLEKSG